MQVRVHLGERGARAQAGGDGGAPAGVGHAVVEQVAAVGRDGPARGAGQADPGELGERCAW